MLSESYKGNQTRNSSSVRTFYVPSLRTWPNIPNIIGLPGPEKTDAACFHSSGWLLPELLNSIIKMKATFCFCSPMAAPFLFLRPRDQDYYDRSYRHLTSFFRRAYSPLSLHTLLLIASSFVLLCRCRYRGTFFILSGLSITTNLVISLTRRRRAKSQDAGSSDELDFERVGHLFLLNEEAR